MKRAMVLSSFVSLILHTSAHAVQADSAQADGQASQAAEGSANPEPTTSAAPAEVTGAGDAPAQSETPAEEARVLILDLEAIGVDKEVATQATDAVASAFAGRPGLSVVTLKDLKAAVDLEKQQVASGCKVDLSCLAEVSAWAEAELVVNGSVGLVGDTLTLNLALVESASVNVRNKVSLVLSGPEEIPTKAPVALAELFGWEGAGAGPRYQLPEGEEVSFAVFDLAAAGVSPELAANLTQILSGEIKRVEGTSVIGRDDIAALVQLEKEKTMLGCTDDLECLAEIGSALGVQKLVVGQIGILGESFVISLRMLDTASVQVDNRVTESFTADEGQLIGAIREAGRKLIGIEATEPGTLQITASEAGSTVFLDGEEVGQLPLPPLTDIKPGRHTVRITKKNFFEQSSDVYVNPSETSALWLVLEEKPAGLIQPIFPRWAFFGAAGFLALTGVATAGVWGSYLYAIWQTNWYYTRARTATNPPTESHHLFVGSCNSGYEGDEFGVDKNGRNRTQCTYMTEQAGTYNSFVAPLLITGVVMTGVAAVATVGTGVVGLFTEWSPEE